MLSKPHSIAAALVNDTAHYLGIAAAWTDIRLLLILSYIIDGLHVTGMHKTGCSGETKLVLHIPSSS